MRVLVLAACALLALSACAEQASSRKHDNPRPAGLMAVTLIAETPEGCKVYLAGHARAVVVCASSYAVAMTQ